MLTIKMNNTENRTLGASADKTLMNVLQGMARTAYGYALRVPEAIYFYIKMSKDSTTSAMIVPVFKIGEEYFEMSNLHTADAKDPLTKEPLDFNFDQERQLSLHKYLGADLLNEAVPFLIRNMRQVPEEFFVSYDVADDIVFADLVYGSANFGTSKINSSIVKDEAANTTEKNVGEELTSGVQETVAQWIEELKNPELKTVINVADYPDMLGEDFMLDL